MGTVTRRAERLLSTKRLRIGVSDAGGSYGGAFHEIPGINSFSYEAGARSVEQVDFFGGSATETGPATINPFTMGLGSDFSHTRAFRLIQAADSAGRTVKVRMDIYGQRREQGEATAAELGYSVAVPGAGDASKAKGGLLSITGTSPRVAAIKASFLRKNGLGIGDAVWFGVSTEVNPNALTDLDDVVLINRVEYEENDPFNAEHADFAIYVTDATGGDATARSAAAVAEIWTAGLRREFDAHIEMDGSISADASGSPAPDGSLTVRPAGTIPPRAIILGGESGSGW